MRYGLLLLVLLTGCATVPRKSTDATAIRTARAEQNRAIADGDADRIASFWTDDVTVRSGLGLSVAGRAAYRERITGNGLVYVRTPVTVDVSDHWPLAFESGTWTASRNGDVTTIGRYSAQWVKRDGRWLIRAEVFVALSCRGAGCDAAATP